MASLTFCARPSRTAQVEGPPRLRPCRSAAQLRRLRGPLLRQARSPRSAAIALGIAPLVGAGLAFKRRAGGARLRGRHCKDANSDALGAASEESLGLLRRDVVLRLALRVLSTFALVVLALVFAGTFAFKVGLVEESIGIFDMAGSLGFPKALLWQRGISLYYADRFEEGALQFRKDVELNPDDTEEAVWAVLCEARTVGVNEARRRILATGEDSRSVMREVYTFYQGGGYRCGADSASAKASLEQRASGGDLDAFYSALYLGLFSEATGENQDAKRWIQTSLKTEYAQGSADYMVDAARVHAHRRGLDS